MCQRPDAATGRVLRTKYILNLETIECEKLLRDSLVVPECPACEVVEDFRVQAVAPVMW
jgi:hypothetical protein